MKRYFVFLALFLLFPLASTLTSDMKMSYAPEETMIIKFSGEFLEPLTSDQVTFKRGYVDVPFQYDLKKIGNDYYLWALIPQTSQNYTLVLRNIPGVQNGVIVRKDFMQNFSVQGNRSVYTISPGFVHTQDDFILNVDLHEDNPLNVSVDFPDQHSILLRPGKNTLSFSVADRYDPEFRLLHVGMYAVPVYLDINRSKDVKSSGSLTIEPSKIEENILLVNEVNYTLTIVNRDESDISDILWTYDKKIVKIAPEIETLKSKSQQIINITLFPNKNNLSTEILISVAKKNISLAFPITLSIVREPSQANESKYHCSELSGIVCTANEKCSGKEQDSIEGLCCLEVCAVLAQSSYKWIGYLLGIFVLALIYILYRKYKNVHQVKDPVKNQIA